MTGLFIKTTAPGTPLCGIRHSACLDLISNKILIEDLLTLWGSSDER